MESRGAAGIIYTDIDRDGTGAGVNVEATARMQPRWGSSCSPPAACTARTTCAACALPAATASRE
jgi:hypothetical protein